MNFQTKSAVIGSIGTLAVGTVAYFLHKYLKVNDEIMEIIFTHDRLEERTKNVKYLEISHLNFSPRNLVRIEQYINSAKKTIDAAVYLFNVKQLGAAIIRAYERGVSVRIVGCSSMQGATGTQFGELHRAGIPVLFKDTSMCMHHKFCLVDTRDQTEREKNDSQYRIMTIAKRKLKKSRSITQKNDEERSEKDLNEEENQHVYIPPRGVCITGSCNWTMQGFSSNWENVIITNNKIIVDEFRKEFDRIWSDFLNSQRVHSVQ